VAGIIEKSVKALIGDFYEGHANRDYHKMAAARDCLEEMLMMGEAAHADFMDYFNDLFSGRTAFNTLLNVNDYPLESVIRELFQNAFDCDYDTDDIKVAVNFKDNFTVSISYNEVGFTLEQFMFYLSFGRNSGNLSREGRFGVGAKSVFMNVEWLSMRSNNYSFCITNNHGMLKITDINLKHPIFKGTEIVIKVDSEQHRKIKENFINLTAKKGAYINIVELCFALNRKKILNSKYPDRISDHRTFNIAVMQNGKLLDFYKIHNHMNDVAGINVIRFKQGGKSIVDFICHEKDGFAYLIPFAVAVSKRGDLVRLLTDKYNYFSTYELTGLMKSTGNSLVKEKLSAFFVSVPNRYITSFRTGIRHDSEFEVMNYMEEGLKEIISRYGRFFVLELQKNPDDSGFYHLRPESYAFEFIKNFILTGNLREKLKKEFLRGISVRFPGEKTPVHYSQLQKTAYFNSVNNVLKSKHLDGSAYEELIAVKLRGMNDKLSELNDKVLYAGYEWAGEAGEGGKVYAYEFYKDGNRMEINSANNPAGTDYDLYSGFMSITTHILDKALGGNLLLDGEQLVKMFSLLDEMYGDNYRVALREFRFYITLAEEDYIIEASRMKVSNIAVLMDCFQAHRRLFLTYQDYSETVKLALNIFAEGKETIDFLRKVKAQGGEITLQPDLNHNYRFSIYETQFVIPSEMSNADLLEIIGDVNILIKYGVLNGKHFNFDYYKSKYSFEPHKVSEILRSEKLTAEHIAELFRVIYVCDLKMDRIALLDKNDRIIDIIDHNSEISGEKRAETEKYVVLREDYTKEEFADIIEFIITGEVGNLLGKGYMRTSAAKTVIPDQLPFYMKMMPTINHDEFQYLRGVTRDITGNGPKNSARNFYAKDINFKLFGYGGVCSFCRFETDALNGFSVKDFEVKIMRGDNEESFRFSLYLCANDAILCDSWIIDDLRIGGMSPFLWMEEITLAKVIPPEFLFCSLAYREQVTYCMPKTEEECESHASMSAVRKNSDIILTPLMAAKWVEENIKSLEN